MKLPPSFDHYLKSAPLELTADTQRPDHSAEPQDEQHAHGVSACEVAACERGHYPEAQRRSQPHVQGARTCYGDRETYRPEEHTSELQYLMRISYAVFCFID